MSGEREVLETLARQLEVAAATAAPELADRVGLAIAFRKDGSMSPFWANSNAASRHW
jgi:hypothetical protein